MSGEANPANGYALSVANEGPALLEAFDPAAGKGLGMRIIRSLVKQIGGFLEALYYLRSQIVRSADRLGIIDATEII